MPKCSNCKEPTTNRYGLTYACNPECVLAIAKARKAKKDRAGLTEQRKAEKAARKALRERKESIKTRRQWMAEAQIAFNKFIRARDYDKGCIDCGKYEQDDYWKPGGAWDCGHFLSIGSHPELRFDPNNAHKQAKSCNAGSGRFARKAKTVSQEYEIRLRIKIGDELVDWLKGPHEPKQYTIDDLKEIKARYTKMRKALETERL